jgi:hypothetical protein
MNLASLFKNDQPVSFQDAKNIWNDEEINTPGYHKIVLYNEDDLGTSVFLWFEDDEDLQFFLKNVWPVVVLMEDLPEHLLPKWQKYMDTFETNFYSSPEGLEIINLKWPGEIQLKWVGNLRQLVSEDSEVPNKIREWFHESEAPIKSSEKEDFIKFIRAGFA